MSRNQKAFVVAVIDIGAHSVRMDIFQLAGDNSYSTLETLSHPVNIGADVFMGGAISPENLRLIGRILRDFSGKMKEYGVDQHKAIATSAVREAQNRDIFIDRIRNVSGIEPEVLEAGEEVRIIYLAVKRQMKGYVSLADRNAVICTIGTGSTQTSFISRGRLMHAETFKLGTLRLFEELGQRAGMPQLEDVIGTFVESTLEGVARTSRSEQQRPDIFIGVGASVRALAGMKGGKSIKSPVNSITHKQLTKIMSSIDLLTAEEIAEKYSMPDVLARTIKPCCSIMDHFFEITRADKLIVPMISTRDAIVEDFIRSLSGKGADEFDREIISCAEHLGNRYHYDAEHADSVRENALALFDALRNEHGVGERGRLLLEVAAIIHDIGAFVNSRAHHKHSLYLIINSQLPGISRREQQIIAAVARYHRKAMPKSSHIEYTSLWTEEQVLVSKLAALLRVADALDRSHQYCVKVIKVVREAGNCVLEVPGNPDLTLERLVLESKGDLFYQVFNMKAVLA